MHDRIEKIPLGGFLQKIHIRYEDAASPILLVLHGGPGVPNRHKLMTEHTELARRFVLVAWDQRGCAGSYAGIDPATLTVDQLVEDAHELVCWLCGQFEREHVFVLGGSWGAQLGTLLVYRYPQRIAAYVGTGQVVDGIENERISWEFTVEEARRANDTKALAKLHEVGPPVRGQYVGGLSGLMAQRKYLTAFGGGAAKREGIFKGIVKPVLLSGEYSLADIWGYLRGYRLVLSHMWPHLVGYNFRVDVRELKVPVYIFQGRNDRNTPSVLVEEYFDILAAPHKELIWFEHSAHQPMTDEPERFRKLLCEKLLNV